MVKLSKTVKMPGPSWSLPAGATCPGSHDIETGEIIPVCKSCYAKTGNYTYPTPRKMREFNREDWKRDAWVEEMINEISMEPYFRWFDSGDVYHPDLGQKILEVIQGTPETKHWLPTRSHIIPKLLPILELIKQEENVMVRYSSPNVDGTFDVEHGSTVIPTSAWPTEASVCPASVQEGKCRKCRKCWDRSVPVVAYVGHGLVMSHVRKRMLKEITQEGEENAL